jgi:hypothetical protein
MSSMLSLTIVFVSNEILWKVSKTCFKDNGGGGGGGAQYLTRDKLKVIRAEFSTLG